MMLHPWLCPLPSMAHSQTLATNTMQNASFLKFYVWLSPVREAATWGLRLLLRLRNGVHSHADDRIKGLHRLSRIVRHTKDATWVGEDVSTIFETGIILQDVIQSSDPTSQRMIKQQRIVGLKCLRIFPVRRLMSHFQSAVSSSRNLIIHGSQRSI